MMFLLFFAGNEKRMRMCKSPSTSTHSILCSIYTILIYSIAASYVNDVTKVLFVTNAVNPHACCVCCMCFYVFHLNDMCMCESNHMTAP